MTIERYFYNFSVINFEMNVFRNMRILIKPGKRCVNKVCFVVIQKFTITFCETGTYAALEKSDIGHLAFPFLITAYKSSQIRNIKVSNVQFQTKFLHSCGWNE